MGDFKMFKLEEEVKETKMTYLAVANTFPIVGERYLISILVKDPEQKNRIRFTVQKGIEVKHIERISNNIINIKVDDVSYIIKIMGLSNDNLFFAAIKQKPEVGTKMKCYVLEMQDFYKYSTSEETSKVVEVEKINNIYKVKTQSRLYFCLPMFHSKEKPSEKEEKPES